MTNKPAPVPKPKTPSKTAIISIDFMWVKLVIIFTFSRSTLWLVDFLGVIDIKLKSKA
jgi:hypothetical protein